VILGIQHEPFFYQLAQENYWDLLDAVKTELGLQYMIVIFFPIQYNKAEKQDLFFIKQKLENHAIVHFMVEKEEHELMSDLEAANFSIEIFNYLMEPHSLKPLQFYHAFKI